MIDNRDTRKPWDAVATVVIPHLDTPDWLLLSVEMWLRQSEPLFILVVDTASKTMESEAALTLLEQLPQVEVARLKHGETAHLSDPITVAMDFAFSRCPTDYLIATHVDLFPKHRKLTSFLLEHCTPTSPVAGWEMSRRGPGPRGIYEGTVSDGFPGHVCTMFYMPEIDREGLSWGIRRAAHTWGIRRTADPEISGWPDTETCLGMLFKEKGITPVYFGRETNSENQETEHWVHSRSRTGLGLTPRHADAFLAAKDRLAQWRKDDGDPQILFGGHVPAGDGFVAETPQRCPFRVPYQTGHRCVLMARYLGATDPNWAAVEEDLCVSCSRGPRPTPVRMGPDFSVEVAKRTKQIIQAGGVEGCDLERANWLSYEARVKVCAHWLTGYRPQKPTPNAMVL